MAAQSMVGEFTSTPEGMAMHQEERLLLEVQLIARELFAESGLTQSDVAKRLGCTQGNVSMLLNGKTGYTFRTIASFLTAFGKKLEIKAVGIELESP